MMSPRAISAACDGKLVRAYVTEGASLSAAMPDDAPGKVLTNYYGRDARASWRPDMAPEVAAALGIDMTKGPTAAGLDRLFQAKRADNGERWSAVKRDISAYDLTISPEKSISLAFAFAKTDEERAAILQAIWRANDRALQYVERELGWARRGAGGTDGAEPGRVGWASFMHFSARPTLALQDGPGGETYVMDVPLPGDPQVHIHNVMFNLVVTDSGHIGSLHTHQMHGRVKEFGGYFQALLANELDRLGMRLEYDKGEQAVAIACIPEHVREAFSKGHAATVRKAKAYARDQGLDWNTIGVEKKLSILNNTAQHTRLQKQDGKPDPKIWEALADRLDWRHETAVTGERRERLSREERLTRATRFAARHIEREFETAAVLDMSVLRVHAVRSLIGVGIESHRDIDTVVGCLEREGVQIQGQRADLIVGMMGDKLRVTNTVQLALEREMAALVQQASRSKVGAVPKATFDLAVQESGINFRGRVGQQQLKAAEQFAFGGGLVFLEGVAGVGKTTRVLAAAVPAWHRDGRQVIGISQAWRQADALKEAGVDETVAVTPFLESVRSGEVKVDRNTVLVIDEAAQLGPRQFLEMMKLWRDTGCIVRGLGDREQCQAQPLDCGVLTPGGFRPIGDLAVGDEIVCPDGSVTSVRAVSDRGPKEVYRVTFSDGREARCCADHLWKIWRRLKTYERGKDHATRKILSYGRWEVVPLQKIRPSAPSQAGVAVPLVSGLSLLGEQELPIPPYVLGALLGDGHFGYGVTTLTTADKEILDRVLAELPDHEAVQFADYQYRLKIKDRSAHVGCNREREPPKERPYILGPARRTGPSTAYISHDGRTQTLTEWAKETGINRSTLYLRLVNGWSVAQALGVDGRKRERSFPYSPLNMAITKLGLAGTRSPTKFIPDLYKRASEEHRFALMCGLMDTDGTVGEGGTYGVYHSVSERLIRDVQELAWSLGAVATIASRPKHWEGKPCLTQFLLNIRHPDITKFFRLSRKLEATRRTSRLTRLVISEIERIGVEEVRCIAVDHPEGLYVTDQYVITHNSIEASSAIEIMGRNMPQEALPKLLETVRQKTERAREIAGLFRQGGEQAALTALTMKLEDGHASLVGGDYDQVVEQIASFYVSRRDARREAGERTGVTVTALTNADAAAISRSVRSILRDRGEVHGEEVVYRAIDNRGEQYDMPAALGDRFRLFKKTAAQIDGKRGFIGSNGDIVTMRGWWDRGVIFEDQKGRQGYVEWRRLTDPNTKRMMLGYGHCLTVDAGQGITSGEHINALPRGTSGITAFKSYVAESRHEDICWTLISKGAEIQAEMNSRALGKPTEVTEQQIWRRVAKNMAEKPYKSLAIDLVDKVDKGLGKAVDSFIRTDAKIRKLKSSSPDLAGAVRAEMEARSLKRTLAARVEALNRAVRRQDKVLGESHDQVRGALLDLRKRLTEELNPRRKRARKPRPEQSPSPF